MNRLLLLVACVGCSTSASSPVAVDPAEGDDGGGKTDTALVVPEVTCAGVPDAGASESFRHWTSRGISALGGVQHRGHDLIAAASDGDQRLEGWISYTFADKALEDENVDLFACRAGAWKRVGRTRTDDEGFFSLALSDADRLPIGMRDLYVSVAGDRTGVAFLAYVAPDDQALVASDVDGTLTSSENAFYSTIAFGTLPDAQPGAADAYHRATAQGAQLLYITARGSQYTEDTRHWLAERGFPRGPVRLSPSFITLPGGDTIDYKTTTLTDLPLPILAGVGNRASDITAYTSAGVPADAIYIKLPEFSDELVQPLADAKAIGVTDYTNLFQ
ncbi:MAG TPA: hypothetical protein VGM90_41250 [Kofleriaceae bacterium]